MIRTALMNVMTAAAIKAGKSLTRDFGEVEHLQVSMKGPADFVSAADKRSEEILVEALSKARPGYGFLNEEGGVIEGTDPSHRWIIDPLDGTTNFLHSIPFFAISIALEREGQLVAGVVYNPVMNELFVAEKGLGAFCNERRLRVAARRDLMECVIGTGIPHRARGQHALYLQELERVMSNVAGVRRFGAAALDLAYVAAGRFDGFWERGLAPWDIAAGMVLIREAGGFISDIDGKPTMLETGNIVGGNEYIHKQMMELLK